MYEYIWSIDLWTFRKLLGVLHDKNDLTKIESCSCYKINYYKEGTVNFQNMLREKYVRETFTH